MLNALDLVNSMKQASNEANEAGQPCDFCFGVVTSASPLQILVEQKLTLSRAQLVLSRNVTDFDSKVTADWKGSVSDEYRSNVSANKESTTFHNGLEVGDKVILLRKRGGQTYLVLDRVVDA